MPPKRAATNRGNTGRGRGGGGGRGRGAGRGGPGGTPPATRSITARNKDAVEKAEQLREMALLKATNEHLVAENNRLKGSLGDAMLMAGALVHNVLPPIPADNVFALVQYLLQAATVQPAVRPDIEQFLVPEAAPDPAVVARAMNSVSAFVAARNAEAIPCMICMNEFQGPASAPHAPRMLRCGHTLCTECVGKLMDAANTRQHAKFNCPLMCNERTYVGSLETKTCPNFQLLELLPERR